MNKRSTKVVPWADVEADYVTKRITVRALADKYGVTTEQISKRAVKEKWGQKREEFGSKIQEVAVLNAENVLSELARETTEILEWLRANKPIDNPREIRSWISAWDAAWNKRLRAIGLPETINKVEQKGEFSISENVVFDIVTMRNPNEEPEQCL